MTILFVIRRRPVNIQLQIMRLVSPKPLKMPTIIGKLFSGGEDKSRYSIETKMST